MSNNAVPSPPKLGRNHPLHAALRHHSLIDDITLLAMRRRRPPRPESDLQRIESEIDEAVEMYRRLGWMDQPELAFPAPPPPTTYDSKPARAARFRYQHITFDSGYAPPPDCPAGARWVAMESNRTIHTWVMRHPGPQRPWMVCLHGTGMGRPLMDLGLFRANWLYDHMGVNVACQILPLHGPRRATVPEGMNYPSEDALHNLHGTLQAVWDVRRVLASLRSQGNHHLGVMGISLGGMIAGLVGDLDADLSCVILGAPVAELGALIERHKAGPIDPGEAHNLQVARQLDAIIFTSAPGAAATLAAAKGLGRLGELIAALNDDVLATSVGPVSATPLRDAGAQVLTPDRYRLGALIRLVTDELGQHRVIRWRSGETELELRGKAVVIAGRAIVLSPNSLALFKLLAHDGALVSRGELLRCLPEGADDHALEVAMSRLRQTLGVPDLIATIVKRGYRLNGGRV